MNARCSTMMLKTESRNHKVTALAAAFRYMMYLAWRAHFVLHGVMLATNYTAYLRYCIHVGFRSHSLNSIKIESIISCDFSPRCFQRYGAACWPRRNPITLS